jgi:hypothetical protein
MLGFQQPLRKLGIWIVFAAALVAYYPRFERQGGMELYRHAAQCLWDHQILQLCDLRFTYPPSFALVMMPFVAVSENVAVLIWYIITIACTAIVCELCQILALRAFPGKLSDSQATWFQVVSFLLSLKYILSVYENQSYDLLILPFILYGLLALTDRRDVRAGIFLAVAASFKVAPLIFLPYPLWRRRLVAAAVFVLALTAVSLLPDLLIAPDNAPHGYFVTWLHDVAGPGVLDAPSQAKLAFWTGASSYNISLRGAVARQLDGTAWQSDFLLIFRTVEAVFILIVGVMLLGSLRFERMIPIDGSILIIAMLMLSPMTSRTHYVTLTLPYYVLVLAWIRDRRFRILGGVVLFLGFLFSAGFQRDIVPFAIVDFFRRHEDGIAAALVLLIYFGVIIANPRCWNFEPDAMASKDEPVRQAS